MKTNSLLSFKFRITIFMVVVSFLFLVIGVVNSNNGFLLISFSSVPVILVLLYQFKISDNDIFTPLNFLLINLFFGTFLQSIYFMLVDKGESFYGLYGLSDSNSFFHGAFAINIAVLSILIGYSIRLSKGKTIAAVTGWKKHHFYLVIYTLLTISVLSLLFYISIYGILDDLSRLSSKRRTFDDSGIGITNSYVILGADLAKIACLTAYTYKLHLIKIKKNYSFYLNLIIFISFSIALILPFIASKRSAIIYFIISMAALSHFYHKKWTMAKIKVIMIPLLIILLGMGALRFANGRDSAINYYLENAGVGHILKTVAGSGNMLGLAKTGILIDNVPERMDFQWGHTYGLIFYMPIPRNIWPEKPIVRIGGVLGPSVFYTPDKSGVPPGIVGEAYLNFGWLGILLIPMFFGIFARYFYDKFGRFAYVDSRSALIYSSLYTTVYFTPLSADFAGSISRGLQLYIPIIIVMYFITKRKKVYLGK